MIIIIVYRNNRARIEKNKEVLRAIYETQEKERSRISAELHDDIGGKLSTMKLFTECLLDSNLAETEAGYNRKNASLLDETIENIRAIVRNQSSIYIITNGFEHELSDLIDNYIKAKKIVIDLVMDEPVDELKTDFQINLYRILQELLHNSIKHSGCSKINIRVSGKADNLQLLYTDNGRGFKRGKEIISGIGIQNFQARIKLFNGQFEFKSIPWQDTGYSISYPLASISKPKS